jgi:hypothetical protein
MTDTFDSRERCGSCYYRTNGECHRWPPQPFPIPTQNALTGQPQVATLGLYPPAGETGWCGEFKPKEDA